MQKYGKGVKDANIILRVTKEEKQRIEKYIDRLNEGLPYFRQMNMSKFILKAVDEYMKSPGN